MDWHLKALIAEIFDKAPLGNLMYYISQRYITKSIPRNLYPVADSSAVFLEHIKAFSKYYDCALDKALYFEFGAGWDLYSNIIMYCCGIEHQLVVDIKPLAKPFLVNSVIAKLMKEQLPEFIRKPQKILSSKSFYKDLKQFYGINYQGNSDARNLDMSDGSIDLIATSATLEHIPMSTLKPILKECYRLCNKYSVVSMFIDYADHYSYADKNINAYNFLRFSEQTWTKFSPGIHYQNRLRHSEYKKLFLETGFQIVSESYEIPERGLEQVSNLKLDSHFQYYSIEYLAKTSGHFVLKK
jgi:hypothetical protein